jgi:hypothetical protein
MYLIRAEKFSITAAKVREVLGLQGRQMDPVIEAGIASICLMSGGRVRPETWAILDDQNFRTRMNKIGRATSIGEPRRVTEQDPGLYRDCSFRANPKDVAKAKAAIVRWCLNQPDIQEAIELERGKRAEFVRKAPITAVLVVAMAAALGLQVS